MKESVEAFETGASMIEHRTTFRQIFHEYISFDSEWGDTFESIANKALHELGGDEQSNLKLGKEVKNYSFFNRVVFEEDNKFNKDNLQESQHQI